nr:insulin [Myocastor coypus]
GIVDQCCTNICSRNQLESYCNDYVSQRLCGSQLVDTLYSVCRHRGFYRPND